MSTKLKVMIFIMLTCCVIAVILAAQGQEFSAPILGAVVLALFADWTASPDWPGEADKRGYESVLAERIRQIQAHGYLPAYDDQYTNGELVAAALCYIEEAYCQDHEPARSQHLRGIVPEHWPWPDAAWKPSSSTRRNLVKGLALGIAEVERLDRLEAKHQEEPVHG